MILPVWNVLVISLSGDFDSYQMGFRLWPKTLSVKGYVYLTTMVVIWRPYLNNTIVTILAVFGHVFLCSMAAFLLTRPKFSGKRLVWIFILIPIFVPFEAIIIPLYLVYKRLGLIDTLASVIINGMASTFAIFLLRNYFASIPRDLEDSAEMDGAGLFTVFRHIYLPLSTAALATITLLHTVGKWNHFFSAVLFIHTPAKYTLQLALKNLVIDRASEMSSGYMIHPNTQTAGIVVALIPLILMYPFLQRYFIKGMFLGAIKE